MQGKLKKSNYTRCRLSIFRSNRSIFVQIIDDFLGKTLVSVSSLEVNMNKSSNNVETAKKIGELLAKKAMVLGIKKVFLDRGRYRYHGKIKELSDASRAGGLIF